MTEDMIDLGRRAVACKGWRWMPGMLTSSPSSPYEMHRVISSGLGCTHLTTGRYQAGGVVEQSGPMASSLLPDLTDPATLGCLLALVREAWEPHRGADPICSTMQWSGMWGAGARCGAEGFAAIVLPTCPTEAEALVAALEAAP